MLKLNAVLMIVFGGAVACESATLPQSQSSTPSGRATWAQVEVQCRGPGRFMAGAPPASFGETDMTCQHACAAGESQTCAVLAVNEVFDWTRYPRLLQQETDPRLASLAAVTDKACGDDLGVDYQRACVASRRIRIEQKLRQALALGGQSPNVQATVNLARTFLGDRFFNLDKAEAGADDALATAKTAGVQAQKLADTRDEQKRKLEGESHAISDAAKACQGHDGECKAKCDKGGDGPTCFVWAAGLIEESPPKLADAKTYMKKACDAGLQKGCLGVPYVDKLITQAAAGVDSAWGDVIEVGDDLAAKYHLVTVAQHVATPRLLMAIPRMRAINAAIVVERYCPAKKAFIAASSVADFQKRATAHCKDDPPTGQGLSGAQVTLTAECAQVYATTCP